MSDDRSKKRMTGGRGAGRHSSGKTVVARLPLAAGIVALGIGGAVAPAAVAGAVTTFGGTQSQAPAPGPTANLFVNASTGQDSGNCQQASQPCHTISYAVSEAPSGARISVAAGVYPEQVVVSSNKHLLIIGAGQTLTSIAPTSLSVSDPNGDGGAPVFAAIDAQPGSTVTVRHLTVNASGAAQQFTSCSTEFVGVYFHDASGAATGLTVTGTQPTYAALNCEQGAGIFVASDASATSSVFLGNDTVQSYDKSGISCDGPGTSCTINNSTVTGYGPTYISEQNGIQGYGAQTMSLSGDTVTGNTYTGATYSASGVLLIDTGATTVSHNTLTGNDLDLYIQDDASAPTDQSLVVEDNTASSATGSSGDGISLDSVSGGTVSGNTVVGDPGNGIALYGASDVKISGNSVSNNGDGIYTGGPGVMGSMSSNDSVTSNTVSSNTDDGILADHATQANTFAANVAHGDGFFDAQDLSTGPRTGGTANVWATGSCQPAGRTAPQGLC